VSGAGFQAREIVDATVRALPIAAFTMGADARVRVWNKCAESILGWTPEECCGSSLPGLSEEQLAQIERVVLDDAGRLSYVQTSWAHKDGHSLPVSVAVARVPEMEAAEILAIGAVVDLTQTMALEQQLRMAQKMEAIGRLAGGVAHDFNNLLTVIGGYSDLLIAGADRSDKRTLEGLQAIADAAGRASALTRQLLAFSRRQTLQPRALDLNLLVSELANMLRRLIGEDIALALTLQPDAGTVVADPGQMEQVILNLVVNARDAMPEGGQVEIATSRIVWESDSDTTIPLVPGAYVKLMVKDTGLGIAPEVKERLFEPFFTTKPAGKGTGLGLSTVYGIVKQTGGEIIVESEPGRGAAFSIYLPRSSVQADANLPQASTAPGGMETILVCDDERRVCELIQSVLSANGYEVLLSVGAAEAMEIARERGGKFDLLLTDVMMPESSGVELAGRLLELAPGAKVLYMSAYSGSALAQQTGLPQDIAFLEKPFTPGALARKVREILDGK